MAYTRWPNGVVVSDPIVRPVEAVYGTHYDYMGIGGWISVPNIADMYIIPNNPDIINPDGISSGQRKLGMIIKVTDLNTYYEFDIAGYNSLTVVQQLLAFADNNNFKIKNFGSGGAVNYADVIGLDLALAKKIDKISIVNVASTDVTTVISAKGLLDATVYTNTNTAITVGGLVAGSNLTNKTIIQVLDLIFAPAFQPGSSSISTSVNNPDPGYTSTMREFGNTDLGVTVSWNANKGTNAINTIIVDATNFTINANMLVAGLPSATQTGQVTRLIGASSASPQSFAMVVKDSANNQLGSSSNTVHWYHRFYYGTLVTPPSVLKANLTSGSMLPYGLAGLTSGPCINRSLNVNYDCTGGKYIYYLFPKSGGVNITLGFAAITGGVLNGVNTFSAFTCDSVTITDRFSVARDYYIFYTGYQTGPAVNINVQ